MSSGISSDTEINSSPIAIREEAIEPTISSKPSNRKQKRPKVVDDETDDISLWSEAKRQSWAAINTNPNAFFYRHCAPGEQKRNGAWDPHEKKLFLETMKVHPPSQGRWGLFAQHIPGRVGYQCRNFYHRLLESGEVKALPEELEKMQRPRKRKSSATSSSKRTSSPKVEIKEEPELSQDEIILPPEEKESSSHSESEEIVINQVHHLKFVSQKLNELKEKGEDLSQVPFFSDNQDTQSSDNYEFEVITYLDNDLEPKPANLAPQIQPAENQQETVVSEPNPQIANTESPIKWTPRMKEPWKSLTAEQIERIKARNVNNGEFKFEASQILSLNYNNPLNLLLFSVPVNGGASSKYINAVRDHLVSDSQDEKDELLRQYFQMENTGETDNFVNYVISTAKPRYM